MDVAGRLRPELTAVVQQSFVGVSLWGSLSGGKRYSKTHDNGTPCCCLVKHYRWHHE